MGALHLVQPSVTEGTDNLEFLVAELRKCKERESQLEAEVVRLRAIIAEARAIIEEGDKRDD